MSNLYINGTIARIHDVQGEWVRLSDVVKLLRQIEWSTAMSGMGLKVACPACAKTAQSGSHAHDCALAAFLTAVQPDTEKGPG